MKEQHICVRCHKGEKGCISCCVNPYLDGSKGFYLTLSDIRRIVRATGLKPEEFCRMNKVNWAEVKKDPSAHYPPLFIGDRWIGMKGRGKCMFFGEKGCGIYDARPMICRIFPFWFDEKSKKIRPIIEFGQVEDDRLCVNMCETDEKTMAVLGESEEELVRKIKKFLSEVEHHRKHRQKLIKMSVKDIKGII
jgi:Fe-S-cluster containining protein